MNIADNARSIARDTLARISERERADCAADYLVAFATVQTHHKGLSGLTQDWAARALQQAAAA